LRKRTAYALVALTIILVITATTSPTRAADYTNVGVGLKDTATYKLSSTFGYNGSHIYVWGIVGATTYINVTQTYPNGTLDKYQAIGDFTVFGVYLVAGNLSVGDLLWNGLYSPTINRSTTMTASGVSRIVNIANNRSYPPFTMDRFYFDKETGLLIQGNIWTLAAGWRNFTLISTTAWPSTPPEGLLSITTIALVGGVGVVALAVGFLVGRSGKRRK
jgi:hypothetical protein